MEFIKEQSLREHYDSLMYDDEEDDDYKLRLRFEDSFLTHFGKIISKVCDIWCNELKLDKGEYLTNMLYDYEHDFDEYNSIYMRLSCKTSKRKEIIINKISEYYEDFRIKQFVSDKYSKVVFIHFEPFTIKTFNELEGE